MMTSRRSRAHEVQTLETLEEMASVFKHVALVPTAHVFHVTQSFNDDPSPNKVNLGVGAFRDANGKPWVLPVVKTVETQLAQEIADGTLNHEYLSIDGLRAFTDAACRMLLGNDNPALVANRVIGVQGISGTGSLRIGFAFLKQFYPSGTVYVSKPTWGNHQKILKAVGYTDIREYNYYNSATKSLDFEAFLEDLQKAPEHSIVMLHACGHNPTGCDPTQEQWKGIARIMKEKNLFPFFDTAYQGFVSGDPDLDAWAVRYFVGEGFELLAAQSFAKNFGLYNERAGNLCVVTVDNETGERIRSQLKAIVRATWSNPPSHGARIVTAVLNNSAWLSQWRNNLKTMADRMSDMRQLLFDKLRELGTPGTWHHLIEQRGMFGYTGLDVKHVKFLAEKHIYLLDSGRINLCGLNPSNVDYIVQAIHEAVTTVTL